MKQIKDMTTAEWRKAWTEIAIAFETERSRRRGRQKRVNENGLCWAFGRLANSCEFYDYAESIGCEFPDNGCEDNPTRESDLIRAGYSALLAAMTPKEFLEICEAPRG